jgi:lysophospholipase L1-like esterase
MAAEAFSKDLTDMVAHFRQLPSKPLVLLGIPIPVSPERTKGITAKKVRERITPMIQQVAREIDAPTIDFYTPLAGKLELLPDTIHPNEQGYRIMAETAAAAIKSCTPVEETVPRRRRGRWRR